MVHRIDAVQQLHCSFHMGSLVVVNFVTGIDRTTSRAASCSMLAFIRTGMQCSP